MGAPAKADWREERRKRAWDLKQQGWKQQTIAQVLGVSAGAVSQWLKRGREGGREALRAHPPPGRSPRLTAAQRAKIPALLEHGAESFGFRGAVWTARRIAEVFWRTFGVHYHRDHVRRLLHQIGWSRQQPKERATQRDEHAIQAWYEQRWPALKKRQRSKSARLSGWTNQAFTGCRWRCGHGPHRGRPLSCVCLSLMTISQRSAE